MGEIKQRDLRLFALIWTVVFIVIGLYPLTKGEGIRIFLIVAACSFLFVGFMFPFWLRGFYKIWMKFAKILGFVNTTIIMLVLFYSIFTPIALILRFLGKDLLDKKIDKNKTSYWIKRESQPVSMKLQF